MKSTVCVLFVGLALLTFILAVRPAHAVLGGSVDSVERDRRILAARPGPATAYDRYTVQEMQYDETSVREYVSPSGVVFGIAWNGFVHPDLTQLLGTYFDEYNEALQRTPRKHGRARSEVKTKGVVVEKWGHMRNLQGRAYAPELVPPGVSIDEIR